MKAARKNWIDGQCRIIVNGEARGDSQKTYRLLKTFTETGQHMTSVIEDSNSRFLAENSALLNRWTECYEDLYNFQKKTNANILQTNQIRTSKPADQLREQTEKALRSLRGGKSRDVDKLPSELRHQVENETTKTIAVLC